MLSFVLSMASFASFVWRISNKSLIKSFSSSQRQTLMATSSSTTSSSSSARQRFRSDYHICDIGAVTNVQKRQQQHYSTNENDHFYTRQHDAILASDYACKPTSAYKSNNDESRKDSSHAQRVQVEALPQITANPVLLLQGDEFHVSHDGIARSFYQLNTLAMSSLLLSTRNAVDSSQWLSQQLPSNNKPVMWGIEEQYDLLHAKKTYNIHSSLSLSSSSPFLIQDQSPSTTSNDLYNNDAKVCKDNYNYNQKPQEHKRARLPTVYADLIGRQAQGVVPLLTINEPALATLQVDELEQSCITGPAGTGATTWEASLAMALFYSLPENNLWKPSTLPVDDHVQQPNVKKIIEVGCGVGGGSLLTCLTQAISCAVVVQSEDDTERMTSVEVTLTDGNSNVLEQCRRNINRLEMQQQQSMQRSWTSLSQDTLPLPTINVQQLKWGKANVPEHQRGLYDVVVACDCAYLDSHVDDLVETLLTLRRPNGGQIHLWGPYNRSALHKVCQELQKSLKVNLEIVTLDRFRLKPVQRGKDTQGKYDDPRRLVSDAEYASKASVKFLHVTAVDLDKVNKPVTTLEDID